jgi:uncharacterized protein YybS (DUF2232 family)
MMKGLAIYSVIAISGFSVYSIYFALAGDNAPFWLAISIICLPVIAFALLYLVRKH